ncbi:TetR/AcrR family transcriptional regulator [Hoeflea olei]|uniref:HTH tetR-type domain-containing protein n=1 Tax=Hoeflea olei TaxID=1480615 RepID=A0A1C1YYV2_9HYPH|nr:TetR/AcrR family transcriptional regulator [Hoeflea olei]OCW58590.1 hypothetical protein AWJ14_05450 [Hoeflea olei]
MDDKDHRILEAAIAVFARYGVRKATMGDIADHAGVSRQTLYARYSGKGEIIDAALRLVTEKVVGEVSAAWKKADSTGDRLDIFFDRAIVQFFEQTRQMPDSGELMAVLGGNPATGEAGGGTAEQGKIDLLAGLFAPYEKVLSASGATPRDLAEFVYRSSTGFKFTALDSDHLGRLLAVLKQATLKMLGEA